MQKSTLPKLKLFFLFFLYQTGFIYGQAAIGNKNISTVAQLDLNHANRGLLLPLLSVTESSNDLLPVQNPAVGLLLYNKALPPIRQNLKKGTTFWGDGSRYQTMSTATGVHDVLADSHIPLLVLSSKIGPKATVPCGTGACGGSIQKLVPLASEIMLDLFKGWIVSSSRYEIIESGVYVVEYFTDLSNSGNQAGTSTLNMTLNGSSQGFAFGRFVSAMNRAYGTFSTVIEVNEGDTLDFYYSFTANNYRIQEATINLYKY